VIVPVDGRDEVAYGVVEWDVMIHPQRVAVVVRAPVPVDMTAIQCGIVESQRSAVPRPSGSYPHVQVIAVVGGVRIGPKPDVEELPPVVVMAAMIEWGGFAELFTLHRTCGVILDAGGVITIGPVSQIAGETVESPGLVIVVVDCPPRGVGHGLDGAGQIVGLLGDKRGSPIVPAPETLLLIERPSERVVAVYRRLCGVNAAFLGPLIA